MLETEKAAPTVIPSQVDAAAGGAGMMVQVR